MCIFSRPKKVECPPEIDIDGPRFDHTTFSGRTKEYFSQNNPKFTFIPDSVIKKAKDFVDQFRANKLDDPSPEEVWDAKYLSDSAYHPETEQTVEYPARRQTRILLNSLVAGGVLAYYKNAIGVVLWHSLNQGFNALVTAKNNTKAQKISDETLYKAYGAATAVAIVTAIGLNAYCKTLYDKIYWRTVPFAAIALADCVRVPMLRENDLHNGVKISSIDNKPLGTSKNAAARAVGDDVFCRIMMAAPALIIPQFWMNHLERTGTFCRYPWLNYPSHVLMVALCLAFLTPIARGVFEDKGMMWFGEVEDDVASKIKDPPGRLFYDRNLPADLK